MTRGLIETHHPIDVSPEGLRRVLDLGRRALGARDIWVMPPDYDHDLPSVASLDGPLSETASDHGSPRDNVLAASIAPGHVTVATLVVTGEPGRDWSDDDRAMLDDLAAILAAEIRQRGDRYATSEKPAEPETSASGSARSDGDEAGQIEPDDGQEDDALRILLADDLDLNRKLICDMLSIDGYACDSVADGAAAVEAVKSKTYDLVLMDMIMPGMDGMEATRAIRALPSPICDVPIVALTAHSFREQLDNCLRAGMNATLTKPMSFDSLSAAVNTWARNRQAA